MADREEGVPAPNQDKNNSKISRSNNNNSNKFKTQQVHNNNIYN